MVFLALASAIRRSSSTKFWFNLFRVDSISKLLNLLTSKVAVSLLTLAFNSSIKLFNSSLRTFNLLYSKLIFLISLTIKAISRFFKLSLYSLNFLALIDWMRRGSKEVSNSLIKRLIVFKLSFVFSNLRKDSSLCFLYFKTPAASSMITLLASGLLLTISSTVPWEIML